MTATAPVVYCGRCGRTARFLARSIDPRYPLVRCGERTDRGTWTGCGELPGTSDRTYAAQLVKARRGANLARFHDAHMRKGVPVVDCPQCELFPPQAHATEHAHHEPSDRRAMIKHLYVAHGNRADITNPDRYPLAELAEHHRGLHR
jgi:hypothetical protein